MDLIKGTEVDVYLHLNKGVAHIITPYHCSFHADYIFDKLTSTDEYEPDDMFVDADSFAAIFQYNIYFNESIVEFHERMYLAASYVAGWAYSRTKFIRNSVFTSCIKTLCN